MSNSSKRQKTAVKSCDIADLLIGFRQGYGCDADACMASAVSNAIGYPGITTVANLKNLHGEAPEEGGTICDATALPTISSACNFLIKHKYIDGAGGNQQWPGMKAFVWPESKMAESIPAVAKMRQALGQLIGGGLKFFFLVVDFPSAGQLHLIAVTKIDQFFYAIGGEYGSKVVRIRNPCTTLFSDVGQQEIFQRVLCEEQLQNIEARFPPEKGLKPFILAPKHTLKDPHDLRGLIEIEDQKKFFYSTLPHKMLVTAKTKDHSCVQPIYNNSVEELPSENQASSK